MKMLWKQDSLESHDLKHSGHHIFLQLVLGNNNRNMNFFLAPFF